MYKTPSDPWTLLAIYKKKQKNKELLLAENRFNEQTNKG